MEPKMGRTYLFYETTKEIWDLVQEMFSDLKNSSQCFELRLAIRTTKQGMISVTEYFNILVELWHEMNMFYTVSWTRLEDPNEKGFKVKKKYNRGWG